MVIIVLASSAIAVALTYTASADQRWLHRPLLAFPARVTAALAAIVALKGWSELFGPAAGAFVWLTTVLLAAILLMFAALLRRLMRLGDVVASGEHPPPQRAVDLTRLND